MLQKSTIQALLEFFAREPTKEHYLKDISRRTKIAHTSIAKNLERLRKENLIEKRVDKKGSRDYPVYFAKQNDEFRFQKKMLNIMQLHESRLLAHLKDHYAPAAIIVFGSYSHGEDTEESDIDIYVQAAPKKTDLRRYERMLGRKIQLHESEDFGRYPEELKNNILNGVILQGYLEIFG